MSCLREVWTTTLKNFGYFGCFYNQGVIFLRSLTNIEVLKTVVSKYGDYKNSDGTSSDSKSGDYLKI